MKTSSPLLVGLLAAGAQAQQTVWGQCGGENWTGPTTCVSGTVCTYSNPWYSQCLPGTATTAATTAAMTTSTTSKTTPTTSKAASITSKMTTSSPLVKTTTTTTSSIKPATTTKVAAATGFKWLGVDESCAEFGNQNIPGVYNTDFTFASTSTLDTLMAEGYNIFRFPFLMERMALGSITTSLTASYLANYSVAINHVTSKGGWAIVDPHNFGRYNGAIITNTASFQTFWANLASAFKGNSKVIFDTNNEYHDMDISLIVSLNQAAINGIRGAGATSQYIFAEGDSYSAAMYWNTTSDAMKTLTDPENLIVYEMHQYLDSDNSGTSATCVSGTVGVERIEGATAWLRANGKIGILGEFAGGANSVCMSAVTGMLNHMKANSDVWTGALWWAGGPWWGSYIYSFEPPSGTGYTYYDSTFKTYAP